MKKYTIYFFAYFRLEIKIKVNFKNMDRLVDADNKIYLVSPKEHEVECFHCSPAYEQWKNVQEIKHKCSLLDEKYNLEKKHFETIKNKNENILSDKEHLLKQNEEDIEKYNSKLSEIDKELGYLKTSISDLCWLKRARTRKKFGLQ